MEWEVIGLRPKALGDNLPLLTYPAVAGYLNEGECGESFIW